MPTEHHEHHQQPKQQNKSKRNIELIIFVIAVGAVLVIGLGTLYLNYTGNNLVPLNKNYSNLLSTLSSLTSNYSILKSEYTALYNATVSNTVNGSVPTLTEKIYINKNIVIDAPKYNYQGYNRVTQCYFTSGGYNLSFVAPYPGYLVFNESNNGLPNNFTNSYLALYFSTQKPYYNTVSTYNGTGVCTGWTIWSSVSPWTVAAPINNQTMIVPVRAGTNYILFSNSNVNQQKGIAPRNITVTFSAKYFGFKT